MIGICSKNGIFQRLLRFSEGSKGLQCLALHMLEHETKVVAGAAGWIEYASGTELAVEDLDRLDDGRLVAGNNLLRHDRREWARPYGAQLVRIDRRG
jgi:hypothetical protein